MPLSVPDVEERLCGVALGLLTPFDQDNKVDHSKLEVNAQALYDEGVQTFLATANISEYHSLSQRERLDVTETSVNSLPSDACVVAGVGGSTHDAQDLITGYDRLGVDAVMIMPPNHTFIHERGLLKYYRDLDSVTDTPLVPYIRGFDPSSEFIADLTRVDGVVGIKYALKDAVKLASAISSGDDDVVWVNGLAEPYAVTYWAEGIDGFSGGISNFRPEVGLELHRSLTDGNWERARQLRNICLPYQKFRDETGQNNTISGAISVSAVKKGLEMVGLHGGHVREPICPLSAEDERRAEKLYSKLDAEIDRLIG